MIDRGVPVGQPLRPSTVGMLCPAAPSMTVLTVVIMPTKDGPAKRLEAWIARAKRDRWQPRAPVPDVFSKSVTIPAEGPFAHPDVWQPIRDAFKAFELDVEHPGDWQRLLYCLAEAHFGKRRGNPKAWDENRMCRLRVDFDTTKRDNPGKSNEEIYKLLLEKDRYQTASIRTQGNRRDRALKTLQRQMPAARAAYKRTIERLAIAKLAWERKHGNPDAGPAAKEQAIKFAKEALQASAAPPPEGLGGDVLWNTIFGDLGDAHFWRSDASFWFSAEVRSPVTPRILAEARKHDELKEGLKEYLADWHKRALKREK
jgi:hypothetical protein